MNKLQRRALSDDAMTVYLRLLRLSRWCDVYATYMTLHVSTTVNIVASQTGLKQRAVEDALAELESLDVIRFEEPYASKLYILIDVH